MRPQVGQKSLALLEGGEQQVEKVIRLLAMAGHDRQLYALILGPLLEMVVVVLPDALANSLNLLASLQLGI